MADLHEGFWDNLLDYIQDRTVIPVIGPELVTVPDGGRDVPLQGWIAQRLAVQLELPAAELPASFDLNDVVSAHVRRRGEREELYPLIHRMLRNAELAPPEPLRALAGIPGFDLFVSLTFDSLLADAIGADRVKQLAWSPNNVRDLPGPKAELREPVVFHLLGRASASPDYAICDEDLLELLHGLQDKQRQPRTLFDELRSNHLLILGCSFGDWLARFFLRTARSLELSQKRRRWDLLVGDRITHDASLALFLQSFSSDARMIQVNAAQFVTELARRWHAAHPEGPRPAEKAVPAGAIFISYASEDLQAASRLAEGLRAARLDVWFDKEALQAGDRWERSIRRGIEECALFLPVISRQAMSEENRRSYFWGEWNDAIAMAHRMAPDEEFIIPVVIDDTDLGLASLPEAFQRAQARSLPGGTVPSDFSERLKELVRDFHRRRRAA